MSWQMTAHWPDKSAPMGIGEQCGDPLDLYGSDGELTEFLGLAPFDPETIGGVCGKVPRQKIESALRRCCEKHLAGESQLNEMHFFLTILLNWKRGAKSILIGRC
jgi:hypothetical protein